MNTIEQDVLVKIRPVEDYSTQISAVLDSITLPDKTRHILGGSLAKGTNLKGNHDCDIFIAFDYEMYRKEDISVVLEKSLIDSKVDFEKVHGSRDYFHIVTEDLTYELVPVLDIKDSSYAKNVTDMSPMHVGWVKEHVGELHDDIRLAKQFCKAARVYGAESYIGGISGHVLDILVIWYGGFENFLKAAVSWNEKDVIDANGFYKDKDVFKLMNDAKLYAPLIVVDPILPDRNAASALTTEKFFHFIDCAREYLANPSEDFFEIIPLSVEAFDDVVQIVIDPQTGKNDVVGAKVKKTFEYILQQLRDHDFIVSESDWEFGYPSNIFVGVESKTLSNTKLWHGPPEMMEKASAAFLKVHPNAKVVDGKYVCEEKREVTEFSELLMIILKSEYVSGRVKSISLKV